MWKKQNEAKMLAQVNIVKIGITWLRLISQKHAQFTFPPYMKNPL